MSTKHATFHAFIELNDCKVVSQLGFYVNFLPITFIQACNDYLVDEDLVICLSIYFIMMHWLMFSP